MLKVIAINNTPEVYATSAIARYSPARPDRSPLLSKEWPHFEKANLDEQQRFSRLSRVIACSRAEASEQARRG
jgi:hypothetical protein